MATVLLVENDDFVRGALVRALTDVGHAVRPVGMARHALREIATSPPDVVILDLGLPDLDGAETLRRLRETSDVPVIVATARASEMDIVRLLNAGADDYVTKPFSSTHLAARINATLRRGRMRTPAAPQEPVEVGPLVVDPARREARLDGTPLDLTRREFDLLAYLAERAGQVVTRRELVTEVWQQEYSGAEPTVDVHLSWLRRKLGETAAKPRLLRTVRGVGVLLSAP